MSSVSVLRLGLPHLKPKSTQIPRSWRDGLQAVSVSRGLCTLHPTPLTHESTTYIATDCLQTHRKWLYTFLSKNRHKSSPIKKPGLLQCRPVWSSVTSSFHTTSRRDVKLYVPDRFVRYLGQLQHQMSTTESCKCKTMDDLSKRREEFWQQVKGHLIDVMDGHPTPEGSLRPQLHWYRGEALDWGRLASAETDRYWGSKGILGEDHTYQKDVNRVLENLMPEINKNEVLEHEVAYSVKVKIIDTNVWAVDKGFELVTSFPDGSIYISVDFLDFLLHHRQRHKLAFVICKELAHIYLYHQAEQWAVPIAARLAAHHLAVTLTLCTRGSWGGDARSELQAIKQQTATFISTMLTPDLVFPGEKTMIYEADQLAMRWMELAGYTADSAKKVMQRMSPHGEMEPLAHHIAPDPEQWSWEVTGHIDRLYGNLREWGMMTYVNDNVKWEPKIPTIQERLEQASIRQKSKVPKK